MKEVLEEESLLQSLFTDDEIEKAYEISTTASGWRHMNWLLLCQGFEVSASINKKLIKFDLWYPNTVTVEEDDCGGRLIDSIGVSLDYTKFMSDFLTPGIEEFFFVGNADDDELF
jgi:hypothetical protein